LSTQADAKRLLAQGMAAAKAGRRSQAYSLLLDAVELDQRNELAWLWLSAVADNPDDQRICLENVLTINPGNAEARGRLLKLQGAQGTQSVGRQPTTVICPRCGAGNRDFVRECQACGYAFFTRCPACGEFNAVEAQTCDRCGAALIPGQPARQPAPAAAATNEAAAARSPAPTALWPVVAFWVSASLFFFGGGVASLFQFASILMRARGIVSRLSTIQMAWLPMALFFILFGITGFGLAWELAHRRRDGFYGSLLFGLVLIALGPGAGLVLDPPDYLTVAFTGLMPATAIILTLASAAGFET
jgi:hypothetical protein